MPSGTSSLPSHFADKFTYTCTRKKSSVDPTAELCQSPRLQQQDLSSRNNPHPDSDSDGDLNQQPPTSNSFKRKRVKRGKNDPESSRYSHLSRLPDWFGYQNDIMFCGINPGVMSSRLGHHFSHPTNHFYSALHLSGITTRRLRPVDDRTFPTLEPFSLGLTNLASRPTAESSELLSSELRSGIPTLIEKCLRWKPKVVCFVGKGIAEQFIKGLKQFGALDSKPIKNDKRESQPSSRDPIVNELFHNSFSSQNVRKGQLDQDVALDRSVPVTVPFAAPVLALTDTESTTRESCFWSFPIPASVLVITPKPDSGPKENKERKKKETPKTLYTRKSPKDDSGYGLMPFCLVHPSQQQWPTLSDLTLFFVSPSTSARVTTHFLQDKSRVLSHLPVLLQYLKSQAPQPLNLSQPKLENLIDGTTTAAIVCQTIDTQAALLSRT